MFLHIQHSSNGEKIARAKVLALEKKNILFSVAPQVLETKKDHPGVSTKNTPITEPSLPSKSKHPPAPPRRKIARAKLQGARQKKDDPAAPQALLEKKEPPQRFYQKTHQSKSPASRANPKTPQQCRRY